jgi:hypothetical protein
LIGLSLEFWLDPQSPQPLHRPYAEANVSSKLDPVVFVQEILGLGARYQGT